MNEGCGAVERVELIRECYATMVYMLSVDEYGNGEKTTICIRSKAIQIYFWVAFLRICHFYQSLFLSGLRRTGTRSTIFCCTTTLLTNLPCSSFFVVAGPSGRRCIARGTACLLSNIRQWNSQIQNLLRKFFFIATLRKNLNFFMAEKGSPNTNEIS